MSLQLVGLKHKVALSSLLHQCYYSCVMGYFLIMPLITPITYTAPYPETELGLTTVGFMGLVTTDHLIRDPGKIVPTLAEIWQVSPIACICLRNAIMYSQVNMQNTQAGLTSAISNLQQ